MIPFRILNNATTKFIKGMPQKELTSSNQNDFSMTRKEYAKTVNIEPTKKWFGTSSNRDASQIIANRKKNSVGVGSLNANKELMSFTKPNNQLDIFQTKQRVRNGGYTVPPKVNNNNSTNIGNSIFPSQIINTELAVSVEIQDTTPPVVTLNGNASITIEKGSTYNEQDATSDGGESVTISGTVDVNTVGTYIITYSATDTAGNTGTATRTVTVEDTTAPVVTLNGNASITIEKGSTYNEQDATSDGGESVTISGTVDVNTVGTYIITYSATDTAGNTGTATRTVTVEDTTAPVVTLNGSSSITVELDTVYNELGATSDDNEATINIGGDIVDTNIAGTYTVVYSATDSAGNIGTASRTVTVKNITYNIIDGSIPDWQQPIDYNATMNGYESSFTAWCGPTTAANQLGYFVDNGIIPGPNDGFLWPNTIPWDSANGWGDYLLDGPTHRGNGLTDFGWYMNTNNLGKMGTNANSPLGTTIQNLYNGLVDFYNNSNPMTTGLVYNKTTGQIIDNQPEYYGISGNALPTDKDNFLLTVQYEIDNNRPVIACYSGWNLTPTGFPDLVFNGEQEVDATYYKFGPFVNTNPTTQEVYTNPDNINNDNINNALGHAVLIIGYIKRGTAEDPSTGNNTDWLIVRDNQSNTAKNVIVPFEEGVDKTGWNNILATIYVRP